MKAALLQCDVIDGDLQGNSAKIMAAAAKAPENALCIAPLDTLTGPQNHCLLREPGFRSLLSKSLTRLCENLPDRRMLLCGIREIGTHILHNHQIQEVESVFHWQGSRIALSLEGNVAGIDLCINAAPRPFILERQAEWEMILSGYARQSHVPQISVNLVGGYGSAIYNGQSVYMGSKGQILGRARAFAEDCLIIDTEAQNRIDPLCASEEEAAWAALVLGLGDFVHKAGGHQAILGLSGGIDSALVACIAADALGPENVTAVLMPSRFTSEASVSDSLQLAKNLGIMTCTIPIENIKSSFLTELEPVFANFEAVPGDVTGENLQARIRGVLLMAIANRSGALVLNTGNKSEAAMGYSTLYGDTVGAVAVIGDLFKTRVYQLAHWYCRTRGDHIIPENILTRPPSAELAPNQKDTDTLPPYDILDPRLATIMQDGQGVGVEEDAEMAALRRRVMANAFKRRQSPPPLRITDIQPCSGSIV